MKEYNLLLELNNIFTETITDKVIHNLKKLKGEFLLSGEDSGLENVWEEICVQVQGENSSNWDVYIDTIENMCKNELMDVPEVIKKLITYINDKEQQKDEEANEIIFNEDAAIQGIKHAILEKAGKYTNKRVNKYLG